MNAERAIHLFDTIVPDPVKVEIGRRAYNVAVLSAVLDGNRRLAAHNGVGPGAVDEAAAAHGTAEGELWSLVRNTMDEVERVAAMPPGKAEDPEKPGPIEEQGSGLGAESSSSGQADGDNGQERAPTEGAAAAV